MFDRINGRRHISPEKDSSKMTRTYAKNHFSKLFMVVFLLAYKKVMKPNNREKMRAQIPYPT